MQKAYSTSQGDYLPIAVSHHPDAQVVIRTTVRVQAQLCAKALDDAWPEVSVQAVCSAEECQLTAPAPLAPAAPLLRKASPAQMACICLKRATLSNLLGPAPNQGPSASLMPHSIRHPLPRQQAIFIWPWAE